jgi:dynactin complex subunit
MDGTNWLVGMFNNPFAKGLTLGIIFCLFVYLRGFLRRHELTKEIDRLRTHLHTKLEIDATENERRKAELEKLKQERDNLQITVQALNHKPGRKEIRQYFIYQTALDIMFEKAPGFAPAWQITLKEAENLFEKSERGVVPLLKRLMPSSPDKQAEEYEKISRISIEDSTSKAS